MIRDMDIVRYQNVFRLEYEKASQQIADTNLWAALATLGTEIPSTGESEDYRWLADTPEFDEWVGDINMDDLGEYEFNIKNKDFSAAVKIYRNEIEDDKLDIIMPRVRGMPAGEGRKWGKLIHSLLTGGTTALAFDGVAFFSDASGNRLNDNLLAGTISAATPTLAQVEADIDTVRNAMAAFKNSRSEIVGIVPDTFVVPAKLEKFFRQLQTSAADPSAGNSGVSNPYSGFIKRIVVDPGLTDANDFYALCTTYSVGPFVRQKRQAVETVLDASHVNINKTLFFQANFRGNAGYGLPILAAKVVSSVT
jgi:phage major head subunit gpT-like protein